MLRLLHRKGRVTARDAKKFYKQLRKHGIPEKTTQKIIKTIREIKDAQNTYICLHCGYELPKKDATISGYNSQSSLRHIHCPKCGKIITIP